ncbi:DNA phosphorothioation-associated protein 4 [Ancylothrix sp. C2]|uniref:DNA phosphorothioation-associated protein 4 n=1 Tax=Ancylothrix sp. D3o TaxID=2953691 RepID=UPI0021BA9AF8|nr:DNA phosphorothioation-associated protein 4 [Ancylothrix sp. D3o]MCT7949356.1 DNA phosphorothioation-associated protein 4 [Ancylothrix sp. D3o]
MGASRIRIAKNKADLVKALVDGEETTGPFQTYADAMVFAASLGARKKKRLPLGEVAREPAPIDVNIFINRGYDCVIKLLAVTEIKDLKVLSPVDIKAEEIRVQIFEEYANGGLEILREEFRGAVDYTERLLLVMVEERQKDIEPVEDFDLSRFLT